ncbi:MAG: hypothetical protein K1X55_13835 [Chitinophagales bacterium]|nr:hypothetical protein [Chitinophagales bacterium]
MSNEAQYNKFLAAFKLEDVKKFSFLKKLEAQELEDLRIGMQESLDAEISQQFERIAKVAKFMPNFMNAKVAESVLGPAITAHISYYMDIKDAISIMKYLSVPFMAKTAEHMSPEKSRHIINALPMDLMKKNVVQLIKTNQHAVVGGFVEVTPEDRIIEIGKFIENNEDLHKITSYVARKANIVPVVDSFSDSRLVKLIESGFSSGYGNDLLEIFSLFNAQQQKRLVGLLPKLPASIIKQIEDTLKGLSI